MKQLVGAHLCLSYTLASISFNKRFVSCFDRTQDWWPFHAVWAAVIERSSDVFEKRVPWCIWFIKMQQICQKRLCIRNTARQWSTVCWIITHNYPMNHNILGYCTGFWITRVLSKGNSLSSRIHSLFGRCINWQFQQQKSCFSTGIHETLLYFPNSSGLCLNTLGHNNCAILQARMFTSLTIGDLNLSQQALFLREQISVKGIWHWLWLS